MKHPKPVADPKRKVTCIQYNRHLFLYELGDARIEERRSWCQRDLDLQQVAARLLPFGAGQEKAVYRAGQLFIEVSDLPLDRLKSEEITLELMDALIFVHDFTEGKDCC